MWSGSSNCTTSYREKKRLHLQIHWFYLFINGRNTKGINVKVGEVRLWMTKIKVLWQKREKRRNLGKIIIKKR
jgi:hypothetical protein